jgi:hypothetical protein
MSEVIVASTTDSQADVNAAAGGKPQDAELPPEKAAPTGNPQLENEPESEVKAEPEKKEEKPVKGTDKRINKLTAQLSEAQRQIEELKAKQPGQVEEKKEEPVVPTEVAAKFDTFDAWSEKQLAVGKPANIDDFLEARDTWKDARRAQQDEQKAAKEYEKGIETAYQEAIENFKTEHADWDEMVGEAEISIPVVAGNAIKQLENGPAVVYFLAQNPKVAQKISGMPPVLAVAEIGRIAARLEKAPAEETPTNNTATRSPDRVPVVSKAPAPITPLKGGNLRPTKDLNDPDISFSEWRKIRDEQAKQRFRR